jgi:hypothetical protein
MGFDYVPIVPSADRVVIGDNYVFATEHIKVVVAILLSVVPTVVDTDVFGGGSVSVLSDLPASMRRFRSRDGTQLSDPTVVGPDRDNGPSAAALRLVGDTPYPMCPAGGSLEKLKVCVSERCTPSINDETSTEIEAHACRVLLALKVECPTKPQVLPCLLGGDNRRRHRCSIGSVVPGNIYLSQWAPPRIL